MAKQRRVTSKQVAELAGVSQTTVSFVMNAVESSNISLETRERVFQAARELGYVPAAAARSLARGTSSTLAFVLFNPHEQIFADPYVPNVMTGINRVAHQMGYRVLVEQVNAQDQFTVVSNLLRGGEASAIIVNSWDHANGLQLRSLIAEGYPILSLDYLPADSGIPSVSIDHVAGVRSAVRHLISLGHQRIGVITYGAIGEDVDSDVRNRLRAFQSELALAQIEWDACLLRIGAYDPDSGYEAALSMLHEPDPPTAIFGMNDLMALGALRALHDSGLAVPQDVAVMGYDDMRFAPFTYPALTTVRAPEVELGQVACETVIRLLRKKCVEVSNQQLNTQLIVRDSCGAQLSEPLTMPTRRF